MITYLHQKKEGVVGKNSDNFEFYIDTAVHFDERLTKWIVRGTVHLVVKNCTCVGNPVFILTVNDEDKANNIWLKDTMLKPGEYILGKFTNIYSASFADIPVSVYTSYILEGNEEGPGTCSAEIFFELPSTLNASGLLLVDNAGSSNVSLKVVNMVPTIGYNRVLEFYYKKSSDEHYEFLDREVILKDITSYTRYLSGLVPGVSYDFRCKVYTATGELLVTLDRSFITALVIPKVNVLYTTTSSVMLKVSNVDSVVNYRRYFLIKYRLKGSLDWMVTDCHITVEKNVPLSEFIYTVENLESGTNYEFLVLCESDKEEIYRKSIYSNTLSETQEIDAHVILVTGTKLECTIRNTKLNQGNKNLMLYIQSKDKNKYMLIETCPSNFYRSGYTFILSLENKDPDILELLTIPNPTFKLVFSDAITNIVEDIRYVVGG